MYRYTLLGGLALLFCLLLATPAFAATLDSKEAETMTLANGATVTGGGLSVTMDATSERATWDQGGAGGADTVVASFAINSTATTNVCLILFVNGVNSGQQCVPVGQTAFAERSWTGLDLKNSDELRFSANQIGAGEQLIFDKARVDGTAPGGYDSVGQTFTAPWTPAANSDHLNPRVSCTGGDPLTTTTGVGIEAADGVTLTNAQVDNCTYAIRTDTGDDNFKVLSDDDEWGGETLLDHNRVSLDIRACDTCEFGDAEADAVDGGSFKIRDTYRIMEAKQSSRTDFHDIDADCEIGTSWGTGAPYGGCHAGFKWLSDRAYGTSFLSEDNSVTNNVIKNVSDESIGIDSRLNTPSQEAYVGTDQVIATSGLTFTLQQANWSGLTSAEADDYYATIADGTKQCEVLDIASKNLSKQFTVAGDPNSVLPGLTLAAGGARGDRITVGLAYKNFDFSSNTIDHTQYKAATGELSKVGIDTHGGGCNVEIRDNTIIVPDATGYDYNAVFGYRQVGGVDASQAIDVRYNVSAAGAYGTGMYSPTALVSITGNTVNNTYGDISLGAVSWNAPYAGFATKNYVASNTMGSGQVYKLATHSDLASDPN